MHNLKNRRISFEYIDIFELEVIIIFSRLLRAAVFVKEKKEKGNGFYIYTRSP